MESKAIEMAASGASSAGVWMVTLTRIVSEAPSIGAAATVVS